MADQYRGIISFDLRACPSIERQRLMKAFEQIGWHYTGTSAVAIDLGSLAEIQSALEVVARQMPDLGSLTGLSIQVQRVHPNAGPYTSDLNPANALSTIKAKQLP